MIKPLPKGVPALSKGSLTTKSGRGRPFVAGEKVKRTFADLLTARRLSGFVGYVEANRAALREMLRQVGDELVLDGEGIAWRGLIVRHLVLPEGLAGTREVLRWIADNLSPRVHVSLMDQYFPAHKAVGHPILGRKITAEEYAEALRAFEEAGLTNGWMQEHEEC